MDFFEDEQSIEYHPDYPKRPKQAFHFYVERRLGMLGWLSTGGWASGMNPRSISGKGSSVVNVPKGLNNEFKRKDDLVAKECKRLAEVEREKYGKALERFLQTNRAEMFERQIDYIEKKLKNYTKVGAREESGRHLLTCN